MKRWKILIFLVLLVELKYASPDLYDDQPKILVNDGNLVFESADSRDVSVKLRGRSRFFVNNIDVLASLSNVTNAGGSHSQSSPEVIAALLQQVSSLKDTVRRQNIRLNDLELGSTGGSSGSNRSESSGDAVNSRRMRSINMRVTNLERRLANLTERLSRDHCKTYPCQNGGTCFSLFDTYRCECPSNYEGPQCSLDVNECARYVGTDLGCQNGATCINTVGSYECSCTQGWNGKNCNRRKVDCLSATSFETCEHGTCVPSNNKDGYTCLCEQGWRSDNTSRACTQDVNECEEMRPHCSVDPKVICINTPGSFVCGPCPAGYQGNGFYCEDIDECQVNNGGCSTSPRVECINTRGSYRCGQCPLGFEGDGRICTPRGQSGLNQCADSSVCNANAICIQYRNSPPQCSCKFGFTGSGYGERGCSVLSADPCNALYCRNGGTCVRNGTSAYCNCPSGTSPPLCDRTINSCDPNPCRNGGNCTNMRFGPGFRCTCARGFIGNLCENQQTSCGGVLTTENGTLRYPTDPRAGVYQHNSRCAWLIRTNASKVLNITFTNFNIEFSNECRYDFLQIHDGRSAAAHIIGRFCGSSLPKGGNIVSTHHQLYLWFRSDNSTAHDGFELTWTSVDPVCGGVLNVSSHGTISSPGSPGNYPINSDCEWNIHAPPGKRIQFLFYTLMIESHRTCNFDFLELHSGVGIETPSLGKFCNSTVPAPLLTPGNEATIHFHSDGDSTDAGFQIAYSVVEGIPGCGGVYTASKGDISSPLNIADGTYKHNLLCDYVIRMPSNSRVRLEFKKFGLEESSNCKFDAVEIYEGEENSDTLLGRYCGTTMPPIVTSRTNIITIKFISDWSTSDVGFQLQYQLICGGIFTAETGVLKSPNYPNSYDSDCMCEYDIVAPQGKVIVLNVLDFDMEQHSTCEFDNLEIFDSSSSDNSTSLGRFCGESKPGIITSSFNHMHIRFATDSSVFGRGFQANYTFVDVKCGGLIRDAKELVKPPLEEDGNGVYEANALCKWLILAPKGFVIQMNVLTFELESDATCRYDYLVIYNNGSGNGEKVGPFCGTTIPRIITTVDNMATIVFSSDSSTAKDGFTISFNFIDGSKLCGGNFHSTRGTFRSPGSPQYLANKNCEWIVSVPNGQQIEVSFKYFEVESHTTCRFDGLEVHNGGSSLAPLLGRFCGETIPASFRSMGNQLYFRFYSDASRSGTGFELEWDGTSVGCGGIVTALKGTIISPNFPLNYPHNAQCEWRITVNAGSSIHIIFSDLDLEANTECKYDYLEIFDGPDVSTRSFGRFCEHHPMHIETTGNHAMIRMNTDGSHSGRGFQIKYNTNCNRTIMADTGIIESPNFPEEYPNNIDCMWTIKVSKGNKITMQFSHFELENDNIYHNETNDHQCQYDYVKIYDYDYESKGKMAQKTYCNKAPEIRTSTTDAVVVLFHTDPAEVGTGFRLEWYNEGCGGRLTHPEGGFTSPNYPKRYDHEVECTWQIEVDYGYSIKLTVHDFDIESSSSCQFDSLTIAHDRSFNESVIAKICRTLAQPMVISSDSHQLFVRFETDESHSGKGFNITYERVLSSCGGIFTAPNGVIKTPSYPTKNYENNKTCEWLIRTDNTHSIEFQLTDFDLELSRNCTKDSLVIFDPIFNETLWSGCGSEMPNSTVFRSKRNEMVLRLIADETINAKGFIGNFSIACGGRFVVEDGSGELAYRKTSDHVECEWSIVAADPRKRVTLTFTYTQVFLALVSECLYSIEVFEGDSDALGASRASFCTSKTPPAIISHGNALTVRFNAAKLGRTPEFDMHYTVMDNACGGTYTRSVQSEFASPNYPDSTPLSSYCIWRIAASEGNKLVLEVKNFDVAASSDCNDNYLEIRKESANGELIGVYCGEKKPETIDSSSSFWIKYKTDDSSVNNGFLAEYKYNTHSNLWGERGKIESPNYSSYFRNNQVFTYRIAVSQGSVISLVFKDLHIDEDDSDECDSDILIYNGFDDSAVTLGEEICSEQTEPIISDSNIIFIQFRNDFNTKTRFQLEWKRVDKNFTGGGLISVCGEEIISINNITDIINVTSPGYPSGYEPNLQCEWTILSAFPAYHPVIQFTDVNLEDNDGCVSDMVKVSGSHPEGGWRVLDTLCAMDIRERRSYHGTPNLKIEFHSDYSKNETGFAAVVGLTCGGVLTQRDGIIEFNVSLINAMRFYGDCMWNITVGRGRKIQFEFLQIDMRNTSEGGRGYVVLRNGHDETAPFLGIGQYNTKREIPPTTGNRAFVKYTISLPIVNSFKLRYAEVQQECGGQVTLSTGALPSSVISTPNYPNIPHPHIECTWIIIAPAGREIRIDFIDRFDLMRAEDDGVCVKEFVELREGSTEVASVIGTYCGANRPPTVYTKSNVMRVKFFTDIAEPKNGFRANVSIGVCGGTVRATGIGYLSSPKYPGVGAYPSTAVCDYRIIGPANALFLLTILDIDLPARESSEYINSEEEVNMHECDLKKDHLEIFSLVPDGANETLQTLGMFCSDHPRKRDILSDSNEILVRFSTFARTSQLYRGFQIFYNASRLGCGGDLNTDSGYITSIGYPSRTLNKAFCEWRITVRKGRRVKLEFEDLDFTPSASDARATQRITIYSDFSYSSRMMFITNSTDPGTVVYSTDNKVMLTAWIRTASQSRGFKLKFSSDEATLCAGTLNDNEGYIQAPNINASSYSCSYVRERRPTVAGTHQRGTFAMYFTNLAVGRRVMNCRFAATSLTVWREAAAIDEDSKYLARICGNATDKMTVLSPFPDVRLDVKQSPYFGGVNFTLHYKTHACGGLVKASGSNPIMIGNAPADTANYEVFDCAMQVKYEEGFTVAIKIQSLQLKLPCEQEFISIYNGPNAQSPLLAKVCGNEFDSTPLISQRETVYFEYHTDNFVGASKDSKYTIKVESSAFGCGGILNHLSRRFSTPLYDKPYPPNTECMWEIRADTGFRVGLYFPERFFIEASANCSKDFLEFYDFVDNEWTLMRRVCGRDTPAPVNSTSTKLRVIFHSDDATSGDGFLATWDQLCGGEIQVREEKRVLSSPRFPRFYDPNLHCNYTFVAKNPESFINLKFTDFNVETLNGKCIFDNVTIYKYLDYTTPPEPSKVGVYCGPSNPGHFRYKSKITMIFRTDKWVERQGFQLEYNLDTCGGVVSTPQTISSPPILGADKRQDAWEYVGAMNCVWNISAPADHKIVLKFDRIALEFSEYCSFDFIEVFNGTLDEEKNRLVRLCNNLTIPPISIENSHAVVKMRSEQTKDYIGFSAAVIFKKKCDESITLTQERSTYVIDRSNQQSADNLECVFKVTGDPLSVIRVAFSDMHLSICDPDQRSNACNCDYLEILDGNGPFSPPIGKGRFCGHDNPVDVVSTTSSLYIRFVTDSIRSSTGFKLTLTMQESPCGPAPFFNFTENSNETITLTSPRAMLDIQKYLPNIRCQWVIEATSYQNIEITFNQFELEDSENCKSDSLRIEDDSVKEHVVEGLGESTIYRGKGSISATPSFYTGINGPVAPHIYCGSILPHDYFSTTSKIRIYFESDSVNEFAGFNLSIRTINACARNYTALQGRLSSDSRPEPCHMTITVPEDYTISLYFLRFYFYTTDCDKSSMKVYDGDFESGALLRILCGYATPDPIFSSTNRISIALKFDDETGRFTRGAYDIMYVASEKRNGQGCGGEIFNYGGVFTSPLYPSTNRSTYNCLWNVRVPQNLVVAIRFNVFDMGSKLTCDIDYVEILEENDSKEFVSVKRYCGDDEPAVYVSSKNRLKVHYSQTVHFAGTGWIIHFMGIHQGSAPLDW